MKKLLLALLLFVPFVAKAQTTTNLQFRVTVETVSAGVTNSVNTNLRLDYGGTRKDQLRIDALSYGFAKYRTGGGTNDLGAWLRTEITDHVQDYVNAKQQADNAAMLAKLTLLLTSNSDLLSNADLNNLATIAAKAP